MIEQELHTPGCRDYTHLDVGTAEFWVRLRSGSSTGFGVHSSYFAAVTVGVHLGFTCLLFWLFSHASMTMRETREGVHPPPQPSWPGANWGDQAQPVTKPIPSHLAFGCEAKTGGSLLCKVGGGYKGEWGERAGVPRGNFCLRAVTLHLLWVMDSKAWWWGEESCLKEYLCVFVCTCTCVYVCVCIFICIFAHPHKILHLLSGDWVYRVIRSPLLFIRLRISDLELQKFFREENLSLKIENFYLISWSLWCSQWGGKKWVACLQGILLLTHTCSVRWASLPGPSPFGVRDASTGLCSWSVKDIGSNKCRFS